MAAATWLFDAWTNAVSFGLGVSKSAAAKCVSATSCYTLFNGQFQGLAGPLLGATIGFLGASIGAVIAFRALNINASINIRNKRMDTILHCNSRYNELYKMRKEIESRDDNIVQLIKDDSSAAGYIRDPKIQTF